MKKSSIAIVVLLGCLLLIGKSSAADDPYVFFLGAVNPKMDEIQNIPIRVVAKVRDTELTNHDVMKYRILYSTRSKFLSFDETLDRLIKEELLIQLAQEKGVIATLEESIEMARQARQSLYEQDPETIEAHHRFLELAGISEDQYWNEIVPAGYQRGVTIERLTSILLMEGELKFDPDEPNAYDRALLRYQNELYQQRARSDVILYQ